MGERLHLDAALPLARTYVAQGLIVDPEVVRPLVAVAERHQRVVIAARAAFDAAAGSDAQLIAWRELRQLIDEETP